MFYAEVFLSASISGVQEAGLLWCMSVGVRWIGLIDIWEIHVMESKKG